MTSEMQERIARAMADARVTAMKKRLGLGFDLPGYDEYTEEGKADALAEALAAMKAMREPTEAMTSRVQAIGGDQALAYALASWPVMLLAEISLAEGGKDD